MKITTIFMLCLIACFNLFAQEDRPVRKRTNTNTANVQMEKAPIGDKPKIEMEKAKALPGTNNKYTHEWALKDNTKVKTTFDFGSIAMTKPMASGGKSKTSNKQERIVDESTDEDGSNCRTIETRISLDEEAFLMVDNIDQAANLYPGAIYKFDNYMNGSWLAENGLRNPIIISTPSIGVTGETFVKVEDPDISTIRNAVNKLTNRFKSSANGAFKMIAKEVTSQADASLQIGASGDGFGFSASYLFNFNESEHKKYLLVDCTQEIFMVSTEIPNGSFFQSPDRATRDMMYISSVTYGVRVLASFETTKTSEEISHKLDAEYDGPTYGAEFNFDTYMKDYGEQTVIKMYVIGGPKSGVYPAFNKAEMMSIIQDIFRTGTNAQVQPIKYTFRNMQGGVVMSQSATDYFITQNCIPPATPLTYTVKLNSVRMGNDDDWELYGQIWVQVFGGDKKEVISILGGDRLMSLDEANHLSSDEPVYKPNREVTFRLEPEQKQNAVMLIWYWLNDYDSGSGNDLLSMREGQKIRYNKNGDLHFCRIIPLGSLIPGKGSDKQDFTDEFTDDGGDSKTVVNGIVTCGAAK
jgi:hypothetical protein